MGVSEITLRAPEVWTSDRFINGSLTVDSHLTVIDSTLTMGGAGIVVTQNGSLDLVRAVVRSHPQNPGYYLESFGDVDLQNSQVMDCIDPGNMYHSVYLETGSMSIRNTVFTGSGMLRADNGTLAIIGSRIPGLIAYGGEQSLRDSIVETTGISLWGDAILSLENVTLTSNVSFSTGVAAISCLEGGSLSARDVLVTGSYDAGLYCQGAEVSLFGLDVDIGGGLYGIWADNSTIQEMQDISVSGLYNGISIVNPMEDVLLKEVVLKVNYTGIRTAGKEDVRIEGVEVTDALYGALLDGPTEVLNSTFQRSMIGIMASEGCLRRLSGCSFVDYGRWAVEEETWSQKAYPGNVLRPGKWSLGDFAFWGKVMVNVTGPNGLMVEGAQIELDSVLGSGVRASQGEVETVWGYKKASSGLQTVIYSVSARWGNAQDSIDFHPSKGLIVELELTLSDVSIFGMRYEGDNVVVTISCTGSAAGAVVLTCYMDGAFWSTTEITLEKDDQEDISIDIGDLDPGEHTFKAQVYSRNEYDGGEGALLGNNSLETNFVRKEKKDSDWLYLIAFILIIVSALLLIATLLFRRWKD